MKRVTLILAAAVIRALGLLASTRGEYKEEGSRGRKGGREGRETERSSVREGEKRATKHLERNLNDGISPHLQNALLKKIKI